MDLIKAPKKIDKLKYGNNILKPEVKYGLPSKVIYCKLFEICCPEGSRI